MKRIMGLWLLLLLFSISACSSVPVIEKTAASSTSLNEAVSNTEHSTHFEDRIYAHIGERTLTITPARNTSATAFIALLKKGTLTVSMHDYGGFEKVGSFENTLPTNDEYLTTEPGDVILYRGDSISIYYEPNSWNLTRLGKIENLPQDELKKILGTGEVTVTFQVR